MTHNGQGFLLCRYSVIRQPEPLLSKVNAVDVIFCCSALFVQPGLQMIVNGTISTYSSASIAENHMLAGVVVSSKSFKNLFVIIIFRNKRCIQVFVLYLNFYTSTIFALVDVSFKDSVLYRYYIKNNGRVTNAGWICFRKIVFDPFVTTSIFDGLNKG